MLRSLKLFTALLLALTLLAGCSFIGDFERFLGDGSSGSSDSSEEVSEAEKSAADTVSSPESSVTEAPAEQSADGTEPPAAESGGRNE